METIKVVEKPWGQEMWLAYDNGRYAGKILGIDKGHRLSKQYHEKKHETLFLFDGIAEVEFNDEVIRMEQKDILVVKPKDVHRIKAITDCVFLEFSSPELDDVIRLEDDYERI